MINSDHIIVTSLFYKPTSADETFLSIDKTCTWTETNTSFQRRDKAVCDLMTSAPGAAQ